jgi:membrane protein implicated in regulation of membrane protease activity
MNWWAWVIAGAIFLGAELGLINAQFYLVFAALALITLTAFRRTLYERLKADLPSPVSSGPAGELVTVPARLVPGDSCQIEYRGSHWTLTNGAADAIEAGTRARIARVEGLSLIVRPDA